MAASVSERSTYRPEIQGIRTIGALLVACFHIWGGRVSGGVDVFFVISGFLITGSLYREVQRDSTIDVIAFWGRIAKRIAPMAYAVLTLTLCAALLWMPLARQEGFLSEVLYSAFHLENLKLAMNSVDYLAREEAPSPVQQFWALSVQVQFYAVWPFLLMATAAAARRLRSTQATFVAALGLISLASLAYSIIQTAREPDPTYFDTFARVWEFALGGILAIALPHVSVPARIRLVAGWLGLMLVVSCGFVLPASLDFPGYVALWPTMGAALVLVSGGSGLRFGADRILASRPLVALGDISFSFYLWHWPVLIFYMIVRERTQIGPLGGLCIITVAFCGAYCTHRWLEQPIQRSSLGKARWWHAHAMGAALATPVLMLTLGWQFSNYLEEIRHREALAQVALYYPGGAIPMNAATALTPGLPLLPTPASVPGTYPNHCQQKSREYEVTTCDYGVVEGYHKTIALVGGSHSAHWLPALEELAHEYKWKVVAITKSGCPFTTGAKASSSCARWNKDVHGVLLRVRPDVVFTTSTRRRSIGDHAPPGYIKQWEQLAEHKISVIAIRDTPRMADDVLECVEKNLLNISKCGVARERMYGDVDPTSALKSKLTNVSFIELIDQFCDAEMCLPVNGNMLIYRDAHHINIPYSRTLASPLGEKMRQVRPDLFEPQAGS